MPVNNAEGHGFGTKSIASIVRKHGGQVVFDAHEGIFRLMAIIPIIAEVTNENSGM